MGTLAQASLRGEERALLERFATDLRSDPENPPRAVWLFGSRARGEAPSEYSDVDLLVLVDDDSWEAKSRIHDALQDAARRLGVWHELRRTFVDAGELDAELVASPIDDRTVVLGTISTTI